MKQPRSDAFKDHSYRESARSRSGARLSLIALLSAGLALAGCSSSSGGQSTTELTAPDAEAVIADTTSPDTTPPETTPPLAALGDGDPLLSPVPEFVSTETRADTGIQVAYTSDSQQTVAEAGFVEQQWQYMQSCLELVSPPPFVIVVDGSVNPFTPADDVLFSFDGQINASASVSGPSVVIQIRVDDFDGSLGNPGFNLRSIMGRSLWLSAGMPERDYPFPCARNVPEVA